MGNLRVLLGMRNMDKAPIVWIRELFSDESVLRWFGHVERRKNSIIAKRVYVGDCAGSRSVDRLRKRWIDTMEDNLKKRGLDVRQSRRMEQDKS